MLPYNPIILCFLLCALSAAISDHILWTVPVHIH